VNSEPLIIIGMGPEFPNKLTLASHFTISQREPHAAAEVYATDRDGGPERIKCGVRSTVSYFTDNT